MKKRKRNRSTIIVILIIILILTIAVIMTSDRKTKEKGSDIVAESQTDLVPDTPAAPINLNDDTP